MTSESTTHGTMSKHAELRWNDMNVTSHDDGKPVRHMEYVHVGTGVLLSSHGIQDEHGMGIHQWMMFGTMMYVGGRSPF